MKYYADLKKAAEGRSVRRSIEEAVINLLSEQITNTKEARQVL